MAITTVGFGAQIFASMGSTLTPVNPAGVQQDDIIVSMITSAGDRTITIDASYTLVANYKNPNHSMRLVVCYKVAGAAEGNPTHTINSSSSAWSAQNAVYRGVDTGAVEDVTVVTSGSSSVQSSWTPTGITTNTDDAWVLSVVCTGRDNTTNALGLLTAQGFTAQMSGTAYDYAAAQDMSFGLADKEIASAGVVTCPTWQKTVGNDNYFSGITVALKPAVGASAGSATGELIARLVTAGTKVGIGQAEWPVDISGYLSGGITSATTGTLTGRLIPRASIVGGVTGITPLNEFQPPTYRLRFNEVPGAPPHLDFMRWYSFEVAYTVIITNGVATPYPGVTVPSTNDLLAADSGSGDSGKSIFSNGATYFITDAELDILEAAGY